MAETNQITVARRATTAWDLHLISFRSYATRIFPEPRTEPQSVLVVGSYGEAKAIMDVLPDVGLVSVRGRALLDASDMSICFLCPWDLGQDPGLIALANTLEITLESGGTNLEDLAFAVFHKLSFIADIVRGQMLDCVGSSKIHVMQMKTWGWAAIPGIREAEGNVGRETSPPPEKF